MKFCKDCLHCQPKIGVSTAQAFEYAKCGAPQNITSGLDLVTGETKSVLKHIYASSARVLEDDACGRAAAWFEPREAIAEAAE